MRTRRVRDTATEATPSASPTPTEKRTRRTRDTAAEAPPPAPPSPETPLKMDSGIAIVAGAKLLPVQPGLHNLTVGALNAATRNVGNTALPGVFVTVPQAGDGAKVEIVGGDSGGKWFGSDGGTLVLCAPPAGGQVLVTVYALPDQAAAPLELDLRPFDPDQVATAEAGPPKTGRPLKAEVILHIQTLGDRRFSSGSWSGRPGSRLWIEGLAIHPLEQISRNEIEYKAITSGNRETPWVTDGKLCGSRGRSLPLTGFAVRLAPHLRDAFDVIYRGAFLASGPGPTVRNGEPCLTSRANDPLEAVEIRIVEH